MNKKEKKLVPKLRFPEFRDAEEWKNKSLNKILVSTDRKVKKPENPYTRLGIRSHGKGTFLVFNESPEKNAMDFLYEVKKNDLIVNITFAWEGAIAIASENDEGSLVSHRFPTYVFNENEAIPSFFQYLILDNFFVYKLGVISPGGAGRNRVLSKTDFLNLKVNIPKRLEQQKIADCLISIDDLINAHTQKLDALKSYKKGLMQQLFPAEGETVHKLRFPEFRNDEEWEQEKLSKLISTVTPPKKLLTANYLSEGKFPILDQSQNSISGWTNDRDAVITKNLPLIIFGDHTCVLKIVYEPFAQGADGIKILHPNDLIDARYLYQYLTFNPVSTEEYKRHFSALKEKMVYFPKKDSGEQQKIADCLSCVDDLINAQS